VYGVEHLSLLKSTRKEPTVNVKQVLAIVMVVLGVLTASTAQLTDLFGPGTTKAIVSLAGLVNSILAGILGIFSSQSNTVKDVQAMDGVEKIVVNKQANQTLATLAVDPTNLKIEPAHNDEAAINRTANQ